MNRITQEDLLKLSKEKLSRRLEEFLTSLSPGKRRKWLRENMPQLLKSKPKAKENPRQLLGDIEDFIKQSKSGLYVSWVDEHGWYVEDEEDDYSNLEEWAETFGDLLGRSMKISRQGEHKIAVECFSKLFGLLSEASTTTDILGNQGAPEDDVEVDFSEAIACYTRSLLESKPQDGLGEVLNIMMPLAREFHYWDGYKGLASILNSKQRKVLAERLWKRTKSEWKENNERSAPDEVGGLIALAEAEGNKRESLSIKERFARANARYLEDVLRHYERKKDWETVTKWARVGISRFGQHKKYAECLIKAKENLGDKVAVLEAKIEYFLQNPEAKEFENIREYVARWKGGTKWGQIYQKILRLAEAEDKRGRETSGLKIKLLFAEGREKEALGCIEKEKRKFEIEQIKFMAKYGVARVSAGLDIDNFPELKQLDRRRKKEKSDLYDWLRLALKRPGKLRKIDYAKLSRRMYQLLINFHLTSGKSSRVEYAAYYCALVKELSDLMKEPTIWSDLLQYMMRVYQKKRLIWENLKQKRLIK